MITCIMSAFNEGSLAKASIESMLSQSYEDFELIVIDDGATEATRDAISGFKDDRIRIIRRANDGLSSARNRGIDAARGDYICFLDADDIRPVWSLAAMNEASSGSPDCVFSPGILHDLNNKTSAFYDTAVFEDLQRVSRFTDFGGQTAEVSKALGLLLRLEPQSANKMIRKDFARRYCLKFPAGLFFEDIAFHYAVISNLRSWSSTDLPTFSYFKRYGRPQITATTSANRLDAIASCEIALTLFADSRYFHNPQLRQFALGSACKLLSWCRESISTDLRWVFDIGLKGLFSRLDRHYVWSVSAPLDNSALMSSPWLATSLSFATNFISTGGQVDGI